MFLDGHVVKPEVKVKQGVGIRTVDDLQNFQKNLRTSLSPIFVGILLQEIMAILTAIIAIPQFDSN